MALLGTHYKAYYSLFRYQDSLDDFFFFLKSSQLVTHLISNILDLGHHCNDMWFINYKYALFIWGPTEVCREAAVL